MIASASSQLVSLQESSSAPDLTPMLDVIFILLVFFMLTANSVEHVLTIDLPEQGSEYAGSLEQGETIALTLYPEFELWGVNDKTLHDWKSVKQAITESLTNQPDARFLIAGDRHVDMERLLQVLGYLQSQNIAVADILMQTNTTNKR